MNIAALAQTASQSLLNNQIQTFQNNLQSSNLNTSNVQFDNTGSSFQTILDNQLSSQNTTSDVTGVQADGTSMFKDIANSLTSSVTQTDSAFQADIVKAARGELDNPQQLLIDSEKANISLQMAISVRNKALDAYNDIIKMQV